MNLRPVRYVGKPGMGDDRENIGLIAEEVEPNFPELVTYSPEGLVQGLMYDRLAVILLREIQDAKTREQDYIFCIAQLEKRIEVLEKAN